jgi:hypothetical protein
LIGNAAGLGAETVDKPGQSGESGHLEDSYTACTMLGPRGSGAGVGAWFTRAAVGRYCFRGSHKSTSIIGVGCRRREEEGASPLKG